MAKIPIHLSRRWKWILGIIAALILIVVALSYFINNEGLRRYTEYKMNRNLKGYSVHIGRAYFHPISFSLDLEDMTLMQEAVPEPPVAGIHRLHASLYWRALLSRRLVSDFSFDKPKLYINLKNIQKEAESKVKFKERGWQQALESIYPFKIDIFTIRDGELTYKDEGPYKPLHLSHVNFEASNIRNVRFPERVYPSTVHLEGTIFDKGSLVIDGNANFLLEPFAGLKGDIDLQNMDLSYFDPITKRGNISVSGGTLSAKGTFEYAPKITDVNFKSLDINGIKVDYLHLPQTVEAERDRVQKAAKTAKELSNKPNERIRIDKLKISNSNFGYVNRTTQPNYRLFFDHAEMTLNNLSNQMKEGESKLELKGKFMGTGDTVVTGTFKPYTKDPDFNLKIAIDNTQMPPMSDLFRSYGNFDIKEGLFSFYSELRIKDGQIDGYVKPIFKNMKVYDRRQYKEKSIFHKIYVGLVGGIARLLEDRPREAVATKTRISGPIEQPQTSTVQVIFNMIRNAFIKAILPGFEKQAARPGRGG